MKNSRKRKSSKSWSHGDNRPPNRSAKKPVTESTNEVTGDPFVGQGEEKNKKCS